MATILLQAAGAYLGGMLGTVGSVIGTAAGAIAGYVIDRALIDGTRRIEGPRLNGARPFTGEEGVSLPRVYGTARMGGTLINLNCLTKERLLKAHENPDKYPDLLVRVTGYSAFFASLSKEYRQQIIDRFLSKAG